MTPAKLSETAQRASERYVSFLNSLRGTLSTVIRSDPADVRTRRELRMSAFAIARTFIDVEMKLIEQDLDDVADYQFRRAVSEAGLQAADIDRAEILDDLLAETADHLETEMRAQIERDVAQLLKRHKDFQLEVHLISLTERVDPRSAQFRALMRHSDQVRFFFKDRSGRRYPSQKFIRTVYRDALLQAGNEIYMLTAVDVGFKKARVVHPDRNAGVNDYVFPLNPDTGQGSYVEIRDEAFHPNSNAILKAE